MVNDNVAPPGSKKKKNWFSWRQVILILALVILVGSFSTLRLWIILRCQKNDAIVVQILNLQTDPPRVWSERFRVDGADNDAVLASLWVDTVHYSTGVRAELSSGRVYLLNESGNATAVVSLYHLHEETKASKELLTIAKRGAPVENVTEASDRIYFTSRRFVK